MILKYVIMQSGKTGQWRIQYFSHGKQEFTSLGVPDLLVSYFGKPHESRTLIQEHVYSALLGSTV